MLFDRGPNPYMCTVCRLFHIHIQSSQLQTTTAYKIPPVLTISSKNLIHLFLHNAIARSFSSASSVEY